MEKIKQNHYEVLDIRINFEQKELVKAYKLKSVNIYYQILREQENPQTKKILMQKFQQIQEAFFILKEPLSRQIYEEQLYLKKTNKNFINKIQKVDNQDLKLNHDKENIQQTQNDLIDSSQLENENTNYRKFQTIFQQQDIYKEVQIDLRSIYLEILCNIQFEKLVYNEKSKQMQKINEQISFYLDSDLLKNPQKIFKKQGNTYQNNVNSDLIIKFQIEQDSQYQYEGLDLIKTEKLDLLQALTMKNFIYENINGKNEVITIQNVVTPQTKLVQINKGFKGKDKRGNLIIKFEIVFPKYVDINQRKILQKILIN